MPIIRYAGNQRTKYQPIAFFPNSFAELNVRRDFADLVTDPVLCNEVSE